MILKKSNNQGIFNFHVIFYVLFCLVLITLGIWIQKYGAIGNIVIPFFKSEQRKLNNFIKPFIGETMIIDIPFKEYIKLKKTRDDALKSELMQNLSYVSCNIKNKDQDIAAKIRIKGDMLEHIQDDKWSFRIKLKGDNKIWGMKKFTIQHPKHRNYLSEWFFHKVLKSEGIISLRYFFVKVIINGDDLGLYAVEEHFDDILIENNHRRDGVIIRFDEKWDWIEANQFRRFSEKKENRSGYGDYNILPIITFNVTNTLADSMKMKQYNQAKYLLDGFRSNSITTMEAFDIKKLAKYFALMDLLGGLHSTIVQNIRLYYNPITNKLEPIGFDAAPGTNLYRLSFMQEQKPDIYNNQYFNNLFKDLDFFELYIRELYNFSKNSFLSELFDTLSDEIIEMENILNYEWKFVRLNKELFLKNQNYIKTILNPETVLEANLVSWDQDKIYLEVCNLQKLPLKNIKLVLNDSIQFTAEKDFTILGRKFAKPKKYYLLSYNIDDHLNQKDNKIELIFNIIGLDKQYITIVNLYNKQNIRFLLEQESNYEQFQFFQKNEKDKIILFSKGKHSINTDLIFPTGYEVLVSDSTEINLINSAIIYSQSSFTCLGSEEWPILFTSEDSSSNGILIYNSMKYSTFQYCIFSNFFNNYELNFNKTGAISFYESPMVMNHCQYYNNNTEDALNIIRSEFVIDSSNFYHNKYDAIDADFSDGIINNSYINFSGNDALDFSGSTIELRSVYINNAKDKAISIGEFSNLNGENIYIINSSYGIVNKDLSIASFSNVNIDSSKIAISVFQKKSEFGPATLYLNNIYINTYSKDYLVEDGSTLYIDGELQPTNIRNATSIIYD